MRRAGLLSALIAWSVFGGCAELPEITKGICGNDIVDEGEDCDSFSASGRVCRAPGTDGQCRYDCTPREDGSRPDCPQGWGCGTDSICRVASGRFSAIGEPIPARAVRSADFDGDHRRDLVTVDQSDLTVRYYDAHGALGKTVSVAAPDVGPAAAGDLTGDGLTDLLLPIGGAGVGVLQSTADRTLVPVVQSSITIGNPTDGSRVIPIEAQQADGGVEAVAIFQKGGKFGLLPISPESNPNSPDPKVLFVLTGDPAKIAGDVPVGELDEDPAKPCEELVLGYQQTSQVLVYTPCASADTWDYAAKPHPVSLPAGVQVAGPIFIAEVNGDSHLDLVISALRDQSVYEVDVAYGLGDGTFHSDYLNLPATGPGDDMASPLVESKGGATAVASAGAGGDPPRMIFDVEPLIAVGDLNLDGRADAVGSSSIYLSYDPGDGTLAYDQVFTGEGWTSAIIADFNGNGLPDIAGGSRDASGIDFYNGTGTGVFNVFHISTQGPIDHLVAGDFDGDLITDLVFAEKSTAGQDDALSFSFGRSVGAPEEPVRAGRLNQIQQIVAGDRLLDFVITGGAYSLVDGIDDLAVLSLAENGKDGNLTVVPGSSDRRLQSPYLLLHDKGQGPEPGTPVRSAIGQFTKGDAIGDLAVLALDLQTDASRHLWLIPSSSTAKFGDPVVSDVPADFAPYAFDYVLASGDIDGPDDADPLDEIVLVAGGDYDPSGMPKSSIAIFHTNKAAVGFEAPEIASVALPLAEWLQVVDLDGDGFAEIVAVSSEFGVVAEDKTGATGGPIAGGGRQIHVFWNGGGTFDFTSPTTLPDLPEGTGRPAVLNADADPEMEIAVPTPGGILLFDVDPDTRTLAKVGSLPGVPGGMSAVAGDIDGDGVDDLVVNDIDERACSVFLGKAVRP